MRITGFGAGNNAGGRPGGERDRAAAFRARHSIGQRVRGRILRREANGLTWVLVGGEELLARLEVAADPGDELFFIVRALSPEIMLQALAPGQAAADLPGLMQRFRAAREIFEQQDAGLFEPLMGLLPTPNIRREAFQATLAGKAAASERLAKVLDILNQINALLDPAAGVEALYLPWLLPSLRRQEAWRRAESAALSATSPACGGVEARLALRPGQCAVRLLCQLPAKSGPLQAEIAALARAGLELEPEVTASTLLRPTPRGGVLGELLGDAPAWSSGGLNTRV